MAMNALIGALRVNLGLDSAQFTEGLNQAQGGLKGFAAKAGAVGAQIGRIALPLAAAGAGAVAGVDRLTASIKSVEEQARLAGVEMEEFQRLAYATDVGAGIGPEKLADILKDVNDKIGDFFNTGGGELKDFFEEIAPSVGVTAEAFRDLNSADALQKFVDTIEAADLTQGQKTNLLEALANDATALLPLLKDNGAELQRLGEAATVYTEESAADARAFQEAMAELQQSLKLIGPALAESGIIDAITRMVQAATQFAEKLGEWQPVVRQTVADIKAAFASLPEAMVQIGRDTIQGFINGINERGKALNQKIYEVGDWIKGGFKSSLGIQSPSKVFAEFGRNTIQGFQNGLETAAPTLQNTMQGLAGSLASTFSAVVTGAQDAGDAIRNLALQLADQALQRGLQMLFAAIFPGGGAGAGAIPAYAAGTRNHPGGLAWVGEYGRELVSLPRGASVTPNHKLPDGGGGLEVNVYNAPGQPEVSRQGGRIDIDFGRAMEGWLASPRGKRAMRQNFGARAVSQGG